MGGEECAVCLEPIEARNACRTECGHVFHSTCAFRAFQNDPRCSICRQALVKEEPPAQAPPPQTRIFRRQVHFEISGMDFQEMTGQVRRLRQNYNARRRRVEARNATLMSMKERWKEAERDMNDVTISYNRLYNLEVKRIEERLPFRLKKQEKDRHIRRERTLRNSYERMLSEVMGERPPSSLEQLLVERLGEDLREALD